LTGGDHLDVGPGGSNRLEHGARDAGRRSDGDADEGQLGDALSDFGSCTHLVEYWLEGFECFGYQVLVDDERHLLPTVACAPDPLDDHVDAHASTTQSLEDLGSHTRPVGDAVEVDAGMVEVECNSGNWSVAEHLALLDCLRGDNIGSRARGGGVRRRPGGTCTCQSGDDRAMCVTEGRAHVDPHPIAPGVPDAGGVKDLGSLAGELKHRVALDAV